MFVKNLALAGLATVASAHIVITNPVPYGKSTLQNGPLLADGSDFPCKQRAGVYDAEGASNVFQQGSKQQLAFQGTAVHGGGSCQISVTKDLKPTKDSVWKVIKSIEGGCPARNTPGNIGDNAAAPVPFTYDYEIPSELAAGDYTLAWTWFNKVGNREMYMNCAPLKVEGSGGSESFVDTLPDMFVANIGNGCGTEDSTDLQFPNPGAAVEQLNGATNAFAKPTGSCQAPSGGNGGGNGGSAPPATTAAPQPTAPAGGNTPSASASLPGGVFITVPNAASTAAPTAVPSSPVEAPPAEAPPAASPPAASPTTEAPVTEAPAQGPASGTSNAQGTACSPEGDWNCISGSSFQRCASGTWSAVMQVAAGMECTAGQSSELNMSAKKTVRAMRHAMRI